ncbi:hypothetical protein HWV62_14282 [Athelia sp. TMB]|nr:hypothetical protein HWV62_14282 [Athelia sp. TMB]
MNHIVIASLRTFLQISKEGTSRSALMGHQISLDKKGAYQVRALAGMIHKARSPASIKYIDATAALSLQVGLIHKGNEEQIPLQVILHVLLPVIDFLTCRSAYAVYADPKSGKAPPAAQGGSSGSDDDEKPMATRFKETFSRNVRVHFVGVWDTVSSIGIVRGKNLPNTVSSEHICHFRHALALDERRVKFLPEYCRGGSGPADSDKTSVPHIKEVWFTGTHSDIGGGNVSNADMKRSGAPLMWMCYEAISCGLRMSLHRAIWKWEDLGHLHESLTGVWRLFEYLPFKRLTYKDQSAMTYRWHRGQGRIIQPGQKVHISVAFAHKDYQPSAKYSGEPRSRAEEKKKWASLLQSKTDIKNTGETEYKCPEEWKDELEMDMFDVSVASTAIEDLRSMQVDTGLAVHRLSVLTWSGESIPSPSQYDFPHPIDADEGRKALNATEDAPRKVFDALCDQRFNDKVELQVQILKALTKFAATIPGYLHRKLYLMASKSPINRRLQDHEWLKIVSPLLENKSNDHPTIALNFIRKFSVSPVHKLLSQLGLLSSLADTLSDTNVYTQQKFIEAVSQPPSILSEQSHFDQLITMAGNFSPVASKETQQMLQYCVAAIQHMVATNLPRLRTKNSPLPPKTLTDTLHRMVASEVKHSQTCALQLLSTLFTSDVSWRRRVLEDAEICAALANLVQRSQWVIQHHMAECLSQLASCGDIGLTEVHFLNLGKIADTLREKNGALGVWLSHEVRDSQIAQVFPKELKNIHSAQDTHSRMNERKVIEPLPNGFELEQVSLSLAALESKDDDERNSALATILNFIPHREARVELLKHNIVARLLSLFDDQDWRIRQSAMNAISEFVKIVNGVPADYFACKPFQTALITQTLRIIDDEDYDVRHSSLAAVTAMISLGSRPGLGTISQEILKSGLVEKVITRCEDGSSRVRQVSVQLLGVLIQKDYAPHEVFSQVVSCITDRFQDSDPEVQRAATTTIEVMMKSGDALPADLREEAYSILRDLALDENPYMKLSSIGAISALAQFDHSRERDFASIAIARVLACLVDESERFDVRKCAIQAFLAISRSGGLRTKLFDSEVANKLLDLLNDGSWEIRENALNAISELSSYENARKYFLEFESIQRLMKLMADSDPDVCNAANKLIIKIIKLAAQESSFDGIPDSTSVDALLGLFQNNAPSSLFKADIADCILNLFKDDDDDVQESAVQALLAVINSGTLKTLKELVDASQSDSNKTYLMAHLLALFKHEDPGLRLLSAKTMKLDILELLDDTYESVVGEAVECVAALRLIEEAAIRARSLDQQAISQILDLFQDDDSYVRNASIEAIDFLLSHDDVRSMLFEKNVLDILMRQISHHNKYVKLSALQIFTKMVGHGQSSSLSRYNQLFRDSWYADIARTTLLKASIVTLFLQACRDKDDDVREAFVRSVIPMIALDHVRPKLLEGDVVTHLVDVFERGTDRLLVAEAIKAMLHYEDYRLKLLNTDFMEALLPLLNDDVKAVRETSVKAIYEIALASNTRGKLLTPEVISQLLKLLLRNCQSCRQLTLEAIVQMMEHGNARLKLIEADAVSKLLKLSSDKDSDQGLATCASDAIIAMAKHIQFTKPLLDAHAIDHISLSLRHSEPSRQLLALNMTKSLAGFDAVQKVMVNDKIPSIITKAFLESTVRTQIGRAAYDTMRQFVKQDDGARDLVVNAVLPKFDLSMVAPTIDDDSLYLWGPWYQCIKQAAENGEC